MAETGPDGTSHGLGLFPTLRETDIARMRRDLLAAMPAAGEHVQSYAIAQDVIITFLGIGWWQENLTSSGDAGGYLQNQPTSEMASLQNHHRVLEPGPNDLLPTAFARVLRHHRGLENSRPRGRGS